MGGIFDSVWEHGYREGREDAGDEHDFYSLLEARSEIARHHRDFALIRNELDEFFASYDEGFLVEAKDVLPYLQAIRQIVG